jgi:hypothetical protein
MWAFHGARPVNQSVARLNAGAAETTTAAPMPGWGGPDRSSGGVQRASLRLERYLREIPSLQE